MVAVLDRGLLVAAGPPEETLSDALLGTVFGLACIRIEWEEPATQ
jgi:ABC-type cobalamin/Fe3+-siderophores transport system ATPase subunit